MEPGAQVDRARRRVITGSDTLWLALLVGVALWLRVPGLTDLGLYRDDAWPALAVEAELSEALRMGVTTPGFELFLRGWLSISRATTWAQLPALAASILTIVGVYVVARRLGCARVAASAAGGVLVLSPMSILFATRVKPYQLDAFNTVVIIAAALILARRPSSPGRWAALVVVSAGSAVFSASTLAVSVGAVVWCGVVSVLRNEPGARLLGIAVPVAFLAVVGVYATIVLGNVPPSLHASWSGNFVSVSSPVELVRTTSEVVGSFAVGFFPTGTAIGALLLVVATLGGFWYRPGVAALAIAPVVVAFVLALAQRAPFGGGRIDIYLYPCVALLVAMAAQRILETGLVPNRLAGAATAVGIVAFAGTYGLEFVRAHPYPAADMGPLTAAVEARRQPGDAIVVGPFSRFPFAFYGAVDPEIVLSSRYAPGFTVRSSDPDVLIMPAEFFEDGYQEELALRFAEGRRRVWYLATDTPESDTPADVQRHEYAPELHLIADGFRIADRIDAHGVHADLLVREG